MPVFNVSLSAFVMLVIFAVLIVGTIKAYWNLINDDTRPKQPVHDLESECDESSNTQRKRRRQDRRELAESGASL
jgi:hypothetical protein